MLFSVITPCYNAEAWICQCAKSIADGNDGVEYEHIIIDDGSTDQTFFLCLSIAAQDRHVKFIRRDNRGYCATMNELISLCTGDYIISVDSDNQLSPGSLSTIKKEIDKTAGADFYQFPIAVSINNQIGSVLGQRDDSVFLNGRDKLVTALRANEIWIRSHGGKAISRQLAQRRRFEGDPTGADTRFMQEICANSSKAALLKAPTLLFTSRPTSLSHSAKNNDFYKNWVQFYLDGIRKYYILQKKQGPLPEYSIVYSIFAEGLLTTKPSNAYRRLGLAVWKHRFLFMPKGTLGTRLVQFVACHFPSLYICAKSSSIARTNKKDALYTAKQ